MRLAVFTTRFPGRVSTFFARDMRALIEAGVEIDVFPVKRSHPSLWSYVPAILDERVLPRDRVHHLTPGMALRSLTPSRLDRVVDLLRDTSAIASSAARAGAAELGVHHCVHADLAGREEV